jgi:hypothetical protein
MSSTKHLNGGRGGKRRKIGDKKSGRNPKAIIAFCLSFALVLRFFVACDSSKRQREKVL